MLYPSHLRESTLGKDDQKTGLAASTIADDDELSSDFRHSGHDESVR